MFKRYGDLQLFYGCNLVAHASSGKWSNLEQIKCRIRKIAYSKTFLEFTTFQGFILEINLITYNL